MAPSGISVETQTPGKHNRKLYPIILILGKHQWDALVKVKDRSEIWDNHAYTLNDTNQIAL